MKENSFAVMSLAGGLTELFRNLLNSERELWNGDNLIIGGHLFYKSQAELLFFLSLEASIEHIPFFIRDTILSK